MRHGVHKTRGFNHATWNTGDVGTAGKTFNNRQTLTGRTGAFKDRVTRELRRHTWNQINNQHEGKTRSQGAHGEQNHNKTVVTVTENNLKIILRTSLSGVFRHRFELKIENLIFTTTAFWGLKTGFKVL